jgi:hypothetical protein
LTSMSTGSSGTERNSGNGMICEHRFKEMSKWLKQ